MSVPGLGRCQAPGAKPIKPELQSEEVAGLAAIRGSHLVIITTGISAPESSQQFQLQLMQPNRSLQPGPVLAVAAHSVLGTRRAELEPLRSQLLLPYCFPL